MRFVARFVSALAILIFGVGLLPQAVFATAQDDLLACVAQCPVEAADAPCHAACTRAYQEATGTGPIVIEIQAQQTEVDRQAGTFDDIVGANGRPAIGLVFVNICSTAKPAAGKSDSCPCRASGQCSVDDILQLFVNVTILILGVIGSLVLLMFIYGGFLWVTSRGDSKRIEKGKETITQAVIGFAIVLLSYSMINFLIGALGGETPDQNNSITTK